MFLHKPVLLNECIKALDITSDGTYVDCTLGGGGHSYEICKKLGGNGRLIGIDRDKDAIKAASQHLSEFSDRITFVNNNFKNIKDVLNSLNIDKVNGILMDLGVSSYQLDCAERGFSYHNDAPLDMRMSTDDTLTAHTIVNFWDKQQIAHILFAYGEEKFANRIADFIIKARESGEIKTTLELADIIKSATPVKYRFEGKHPARRTFQAIRIAVNGELEILNQAIKDAVEMLQSGGRLAVISFHSLEDRIVKDTLNELNVKCTCPRGLPVCVCGATPIVKILTRKPIESKNDELEENSRARSAKLRVAMKI